MRASKLCVTVTGRTMAELRQRRDEVVDADLVELRLDYAADADAGAALAGRRLPTIVTCRPRWEGGQFAGSEEERHRLLAEAQQLGAEYVDIEWNAKFTDLLNARNGRGVVLSLHDFAGVPPALGEIATAMRATNAEVIKLAVTASSLTDCLALLPITRGATPTVVIAMGEAGLATRVLAARFGSCWTYAGDNVAPGQVSAEVMHGMFGFGRLTATSEIYGVVGRPISHSLSPAMHNAAFQAGGFDSVYLPLAAIDYDDFVRFAGALDLAGASVTAPFKLDAFERADVTDALSRRLRSANTIRHVDGHWEACNTDVAGFIAPLLAAHVPLGQLRATVLGAGGAARAAAEALVSAGARVTVVGRRADRASEVARVVGCGTSPWPPDSRSWDLLVNATPVGTAPGVDETPLPHTDLDGKWVYDLVYNPPRTRLLRDAERAGCHTIGGLDMLIAQAQRQFEWWTGQTPSADLMRAAARRALDPAAATHNSDILGASGTYDEADTVRRIR